MNINKDIYSKQISKREKNWNTDCITKLQNFSLYKDLTLYLRRSDLTHILVWILHQIGWPSVSNASEIGFLQTPFTCIGSVLCKFHSAANKRPFFAVDSIQKTQGQVRRNQSALDFCHVNTRWVIMCENTFKWMCTLKHAVSFLIFRSIWCICILVREPNSLHRYLEFRDKILSVATTRGSYVLTAHGLYFWRYNITYIISKRLVNLYV